MSNPFIMTLRKGVDRPVQRSGSPARRKLVLLLTLLLLTSTGAFSQWVVTDFYNGIINTVSQIIQSASKIINSEAFKQATKVVEKLKEVEGGVQQFRRIQETAQYIQSSIQSYKKALQVIAEDRHFTPQEIASFYSSLEKLTKQDSKLIDDLGSGIKANLVEMTSAERMNFIMKIHQDAAASSARLKSFVSGIEYLSLRRARTTNDRLKTMQLYAVARGGDTAGSIAQVDFGKYQEKGVDLTKLERASLEAAQKASKDQEEWMNDPTNPQAKERSITNLLNDPMPQRPPRPGRKASEDEIKRFLDLNYSYQDRLENWQARHQGDLAILGQAKANFVQHKPEGLTDAEWMQVMANKIRKGEL